MGGAKEQDRKRNPDLEYSWYRKADKLLILLDLQRVGKTNENKRVVNRNNPIIIIVLLILNT